MFDFAFNAQRFAVYLIPTLLGIIMHEVAHGSLRLSFGDYNTMEDIDYIIETLPPIIERLRSMSPLWDAIQQGRVNYDQYTEQ